MYLAFRWYADKDPIPLSYIRQIPGMRSVVTALYNVPPSQPWPQADLRRLKDQIEAHDMRLDVVESIPVHDDIKLGRPNRDELIAVYKQNLATVGKLGVKVVCYNFMPLFDWFRTELALDLPDGSNTMAYRHAELEKMADPWSQDFPAYFPLEDSPEALKAAYREQTEDDLWDNLAYFLRAVIPAAEEAGVKLAIHPDDPPWSIFGLPRIVTNEANLARLLGLVESPAHGLTFCTGSLGANPENDLPGMVRRFGGRIHFGHCRNLKRTAAHDFHESDHTRAGGDLDLVAVLRAYAEVGYTGPIRPDHGRMIWGEEGQPGYGLYDRALGAMYLQGAWDSLAGG
ncbi:MAG: mannonate dehydratase [Anaerolineales bacterium]